MIADRPISELMRSSSYDVDAAVPLAGVAEHMSNGGIDLVPVRRDGVPVGFLLQADVNRLEEIVDTEAVTVGQVMRRDVCTVRVHARLSAAVRAMSVSGAGVALVMDEPRIVGWLTALAAMRILAEPGAGGLSASEVRAQILEEHVHLADQLKHVADLAGATLSGKTDAVAQLRSRGVMLYRELCDHLDVEDRILAPALGDTPGFGPLRKQQLLAHHAEQRSELREALSRLESGGGSDVEVASELLRLVAVIRDDMAQEERDLLDPNLLTDELINVSFSG